MSTRDRQAVRALAVTAAACAVVATAMLLADAAGARRRAPVDEALIEALEARTGTQAGAAAVLEAERREQTERSLAREARNRSLGWVLLVASAVLVSSGKWLVAQQASAPPCHGLKPEAMLVRPVRGAERGRSQPARAASPAPELDLGFVDALVARNGHGREAAIPMLQAIQGHYRYLPDAALERLCELSEITPALLIGTSTFYARFRRTPVGEHLVRVCHGTACHVAGARHVDDELRRRLEIPPGADTDPGWRFTLEPVACVGCCSLAPVIMVGEETAGRLTPATAGDRLAAMTEERAEERDDRRTA